MCTCLPLPMSCGLHFTTGRGHETKCRCMGIGYTVSMVWRAERVCSIAR